MKRREATSKICNKYTNIQTVQIGNEYVQSNNSTSKEKIQEKTK